MRTDLFDFELPAQLIAQAPMRPREAARLLHVGDGLTDRHIGDLPTLLDERDLLVLNDTRVLPTRFQAVRSRAAGGTTSVEVTLVQAAGSDRWWAFARPGKRLRTGDRILLAPELTAELIDKAEDGRVLLSFDATGAQLLAQIKRHGSMPLPPYIRRNDGGNVADHADYQPVFARRDGAVASPTASLHLDEAMLGRLGAQGTGHVFITLHVGMGTFLPVKTDWIDGHAMHSEWYDVPEETASAIQAHRKGGGRIVAVGTTVVRSLESAARRNNSSESGPDRLQPGSGETDIFIHPGFHFRAVDRLLTNFHLPRSTLFMLVSAFAGLERMQQAYAHAIAERYRFFSYGDACLLEHDRTTDPQ